MKLRLIDTYKTRPIVKDPLTGKAMIDPLTGKEVRSATVKTMFRYGVLEATKEELLLYKKFKLQDGNYYREEMLEGKKRPTWTGEYLGKEIEFRGYKREDGRIGFSANTVDTDELEALGNKYPAMKAQFDAQIAAMQLAGRRWNLEDKEADEIEADTDDEFSNITDTDSDTDATESDAAGAEGDTE